jgi:hypothetical protein
VQIENRRARARERYANKQDHRAKRSYEREANPSYKGKTSEGSRYTEMHSNRS